MRVEKVEAEIEILPGPPSKQKASGVIQRFINERILKTLLMPLGSIIMALGIIAIPLLMIDVNPLFVYRSLMAGAFGNLYAIGQVLQRSTPLIFTGLSFAFAWKAGLFNVGAQGQLIWGGLGAVWFALTFTSLPLPPFIHITLAILVGMLAGGLWGIIPGLMRAYLGISEVITTIMLNFIAGYGSLLIYGGPLLDEGAPFATTAFIPKSTELPFIIQGTRLHVGYIIALISAIFVLFFLTRTVKGFQIRIVGANPNAARYSGVPVQENQILALTISGTLAGLGGAIEVLGVTHRIGTGWTSNWGFLGIAVSLMAQNHPLGIPFSAAFFGILEAGSNHMQAVTGVPGSLIFLIQGLPVLLMIVASSRRFYKLFRIGRTP